MIHLTSPHTNGAFCCNAIPNTDILTSERPPHNREVKNLCKMCVLLYYEDLDDEREKAIEEWNNRSARQKLHDWLQGLDNFGECHLDLIPYVMASIMTLGLLIPAKYVAKLLLKAGI